MPYQPSAHISPRIDMTCDMKKCHIIIYIYSKNRICEVKVSVLAFTDINHGFEHRNGQTVKLRTIIVMFDFF